MAQLPPQSNQWLKATSRAALIIWRAALLLIILLSVASGGLPVVRAQSNPCGQWSLSELNQDRMRVRLNDSGSGDNCLGSATFINASGISAQVGSVKVGAGGYALQLNTSTEGASADWVSPWGTTDRFLMPAVEMDFQVVPASPSARATVTINGDITVKSYLLDASFFIANSVISLIPAGGCVVPKKTLLLVSLRSMDIIDNAAELAAKGNPLGAQRELTAMLPQFIDRMQGALTEVGISCGLSLIPGGAIPKIAFSFLTWFPKVAFDYLKYPEAVSVTMTYAPAQAQIPTPTRVPVMRWVQVPSPTSNNLYSLAMISPQEGWAVGDAGTILHWDGVAWTQVNSSTQSSLYSVCMVPDTGGKDGWIGGADGTLMFFDGSGWNPIDGGWGANHYFPSCAMTSPTEGWMAAPAGGKIAFWNGSEWTQETRDEQAMLDSGLPGFSINNIKAESTTSVWAVGNMGTIIHWDGSQWSLIASPMQAAQTDLYSIGMAPGSNGTDGWAVGVNGTLAHWDGSSWTLASSPTSDAITEISVLSSKLAWAVGYNGTILVWNNTKWFGVSSPTSNNLNSIVMLSNENGWAVGDNGTILHYVAVE